MTRSIDRRGVKVSVNTSECEEKQIVFSLLWAISFFNKRKNIDRRGTAVRHGVAPLSAAARPSCYERQIDIPPLRKRGIQSPRLFFSIVSSFLFVDDLPEIFFGFFNRISFFQFWVDCSVIAVVNLLLFLQNNPRNTREYCRRRDLNWPRHEQICLDCLFGFELELREFSCVAFLDRTS